MPKSSTTFWGIPIRSVSMNDRERPVIFLYAAAFDDPQEAAEAVVLKLAASNTPVSEVLQPVVIHAATAQAIDLLPGQIRIL